MNTRRLRWLKYVMAGGGGTAITGWHFWRKRRRRKSREERERQRQSGLRWTEGRYEGNEDGFWLHGTSGWRGTRTEEWKRQDWRGEQNPRKGEGDIGKEGVNGTVAARFLNSSRACIIRSTLFGPFGPEPGVFHWFAWIGEQSNRTWIRGKTSGPRSSREGAGELRSDLPVIDPTVRNNWLAWLSKVGSGLPDVSRTTFRASVWWSKPLRRRQTSSDIVFASLIFMLLLASLPVFL